MIAASSLNKPDAVRMLASLKASVNQALPITEMTAIHFAATGGSLEALKVLLELKADPTTLTKKVR